MGDSTGDDRSATAGVLAAQLTVRTEDASGRADAAGTGLASIPFAQPDGRVRTLSDFAGDVVLVVNVASQCGFTPQYEGLQRLYDARRDDGLVVLAFPANDFEGQEPGTDEEIVTFCSARYAVTFPIMSKISVLGDGQHPFYGALTRLALVGEGKDALRESMRGNGVVPTEDPDVLWNFEKFLISRDGRVVGRFASTITPDDPALVAAIEAALAA